MVDHDFKVVDYSAKKIDCGIMVDYVIAAIPGKFGTLFRTIFGPVFGTVLNRAPVE